MSSCVIVPFPLSDHCAVLFTFSIPDVVPPDPGLWKLNTLILRDTDYITYIHTLLQLPKRVFQLQENKLQKIIIGT